MLYTDETIDEILISSNVNTICTQVLTLPIFTCPVINSMKTPTLKISTPTELCKLQAKIQSLLF